MKRRERLQQSTYDKVNIGLKNHDKKLNDYNPFFFFKISWRFVLY